MKKALIALGVMTLLLVGAVSYAHMWGDSPGWGGPMMPMMKGSYDAETLKALDETADLRKDMHSKRFEFMEAMRKGEYKKAEDLEKEIDGIREKLEAKLGPAFEKGYGRGMGHRLGGCGGGCPGPCGK